MPFSSTPKSISINLAYRRKAMVSVFGIRPEDWGCRTSPHRISATYSSQGLQAVELPVGGSVKVMAMLGCLFVFAFFGMKYGGRVEEVAKQHQIKSRHSRKKD
jgi:hypothetical protein